ncbi:hypothetical protein E3N88_41770 [Mikania micrantha]|uniref:Reverse transcriptase Ty1/copia-type domain-containing protein n=1 Tax=Mikania micrantha TaxID=192012 RepID=A0A5N6LJW3_9ASTR|nr:hypothetical protein E3N88_41770 [Mikania micrantha]
MQQVKVIVDELTILGKNMDQEDITDAVLNGLDQHAYKSIVDVVHARDSPIPFNELHEKLINHELILAQQTPASGIHEPATAFYVQQQASKRPWHPKQNFSSNGILPTPSRSPNQATGYRHFLGKCQWCNQKRHSLRTCSVFKKLFPNAYVPVPNRNMHLQHAKAYLMGPTTSNTPTTTDWLFDSGASFHATNDLNNLSLHAPYDGTDELDRETKNQLFKGTATKGLYELCSSLQPHIFHLHHRNNSSIWHHRLRHPQNKVLKHLSSFISFNSTSIDYRNVILPLKVLITLMILSHPKSTPIDKDNYRNTTGYIVYLGSNPVSWRSQRQSTLARSSTEVEFRAVASITAEVQWLNSLLSELGFHSNTTPTIYCDNLSATSYSANPVFHSRMKHLALDFYFVREQVQEGALRVIHIAGDDQLADALTKPLLRPRFHSLLSKIGLLSESSILRGHIKE